MENLVIKWLEEAGVSVAEMSELANAAKMMSARVQSMVCVHAAGAYFPMTVVSDAIRQRSLAIAPEATVSVEPTVTFRNELARQEARESEERRIWAVEEKEAAEEVRTVTFGGTPPLKSKPGRSCPVCGDRPEHVRRHVLSNHLPYWYQLDCACLECKCTFPTANDRREHQEREHGQETQCDDEIYFRWLESMDFLLIKLLVATGCERLTGLTQVFHERKWLPCTGEKWNASMEAMLRDLSHYVEWNGVKGLDTNEKLDPCNPRHPVELLYWSSVATAVGSRGPEFHEEVRRMPFLKALVLPGAPKLSASLHYPRAVDSHCHLGSCIGRSAGVDRVLEESFETSREMYGFAAPRVTTVINNVVFAQERHRNIPEKVRVRPRKVAEYQVHVAASVGIHPTTVGDVNWAEIRKQASRKECCAIGECGLDWLKVPSRAGQKQQAVVFRRLVRIAKRVNKPLILHLRQRGNGMSEVLQRALQLLQEEHLRAQHPIHLHSFVGSVEDYRMWVRHFPRTIFGVSTATVASHVSAGFARLADMRKLVLESDAPHMRSSQGRNHPHALTQQAEFLSRHRGIPVRAVFGATAHVARTFYKV